MGFEAPATLVADALGAEVAVGVDAEPEQATADVSRAESARIASDLTFIGESP